MRDAVHHSGKANLTLSWRGPEAQAALTPLLLRMTTPAPSQAPSSPDHPRGVLRRKREEAGEGSDSILNNVPPWGANSRK